MFRATVSGTYPASSLVATLGAVTTYLDTGTAVVAGTLPAVQDQLRGIYTNGYTLCRVQDKLMELTDKAKSTKDLGAVAMGLTTMHNIKQISSGGPTEIKEHRHRFSIEDVEAARKRRLGEGESRRLGDTETGRLGEGAVVDVPVEIVKEMVRAE